MANKHMNPGRGGSWWVLAVVTSLLVVLPVNAGFAGTSSSPVNRLLVAAWVEHDVVKTSETVVDGSLLHTPEGEFVGAEGTIRFVAGLGGHFGNLALLVRQMDERPGFVTVHWTLSGLHTGAYQGLDANCSAIVVDGVAVFRLAGGMVAEQWFMYDRTAITRQIDAFNAISPDTRPGCPS